MPEEPRPLLTPGRVRALLDRHGLRPSKALGQHYLADPNTARKVARLGGAGPSETVLEVGPGLGSLTLALREAGAPVVAVEADQRLLPALAEVLGDDPGVRVEVADALRADLAALAPEATRLVANLPYNIAATLVLKVLAEAPAVTDLVVMVQREVGERLAATPGSPAYGAPSAKLAAQASARVLAPVSRRVFVPEPHVDSVLLGVTRRPHPALAGLEVAEVAEVIDAAFGQRRKTLRNSLRGLGLDAAGVEALGRAAAEAGHREHGRDRQQPGAGDGDDLDGEHPEEPGVVAAFVVQRQEPAVGPVQAQGQHGLEQQDHRPGVAEVTEVLLAQVADDDDLGGEARHHRDDPAHQHEARAPNVAARHRAGPTRARRRMPGRDHVSAPA